MVGASKNRAGILLIHLVRVHEAVILFQSNKLVMWALFGLDTAAPEQSRETSRVGEALQLTKLLLHSQYLFSQLILLLPYCLQD
jgi:hypothetical protein